MRSLHWNDLDLTETPATHADYMTTDIALTEVCAWMESVQRQLSSVYDSLAESIKAAQCDTVTINGREYMGRVDLNSNALDFLRHMLAENDTTHADARRVLKAVRANRWVRIDLDEHAAVEL